MSKESIPFYPELDNLGSTLILSRQNGTSAGQWYTPWGERRTPPALSETTREYTGQKKDDTGLLFYNARYYDPVIGRFISPDTIVPGTSAGSGGAAATVGSGGTSSLTVDFHEGGFLSQLNGVNAQRMAQGFWFELDAGESPSGPANPQALNRYSYGLNNPLKYADPTGHYGCDNTCAEQRGGGPMVRPEALGKAIADTVQATAIALGLIADDSPPVDTPAQAGSRVDKYLAGSQKTRESKSTQYQRSGGVSQAEEDYETLVAGGEEKTWTDPKYGRMRQATLPDGTSIVFRERSKGEGSRQGPSTIDVHRRGYPAQKVRYP